MKHIVNVALLALGFIVSSGVFAAEARPDPALAANTKEKFADQAAAIRQQMKKGGRWEFLGSAERATVEARLDEISALMDKTQTTTEDLKDKDKVDLVVAQEEVNAILTRNDGRRLICEHVAPTGSNRKIKTCVTFAERERNRRDTSDYMSRERQRLPLRTIDKNYE